MSTALASLLPAARPAVMGILNVTPDSFSDGGQLYGAGGIDEATLLERAGAMVEAGVDLFDVGGESTRPGAVPVPVDEELARVLPVVRLLQRHFDVPVSVDTSTPEVMTAAADQGAALINDVRALTRPDALEAAAATGLPVCLMHMPAEPPEMQKDPHYDDVVAEVRHYLRERVAACESAGIGRERIAIDPGFGFGKTLKHNVALFRALPELVAGGLPVLVGVSRKRMVAGLLERESGERVFGSVALALLAAQRGAAILRVHDVAATADVLRVLYHIEEKEIE